MDYWCRAFAPFAIGIVWHTASPSRTVSSFEWDLPKVRQLHRALSDEMKKESLEVTSFAMPESLAAHARIMPTMGPATRRRRRAPRVPRSAAARLREAERLFEDFRALTPYRFTPFVKSFDSFSDYERWKRAQTNPWYR